MSVQREVVFSGKDRGVKAEIRGMAQAAQQLTRAMSEDNKSQAASAREIISMYETQITMLEKRNELQREFVRMGSGPQAERGGPGQQRTGPSTSGDSEERQLDTLEVQKDQLTALRELLEATKEASRRADEIGEDASRKADENLEVLLGRGAVPIPVGGSGGTGGPGGPAAGRAASGGDPGRGISQVGGVAMANDPGQAMGAMGGMMGGMGKAGLIGMAIAAAGQLISGLVDAEADRSRSFIGTAGLMGMSPDDLSTGRFFSSRMIGQDGVGGPMGLNFTREEALQRAEIFARESGTIGNIEERTMDNLELERAMALDPTMIARMERLGRTTGEGGERSTPTDMAQAVFKAFTDYNQRGVSGGDMSRFQDLMDMMVTMTDARFISTGNVEANETLRTGRALTRMGGAFQDERFLQSTLEGINNSIMSPSSPQQQAMQMAMIAQRNPGMSMSDIMAQQEMGMEGLPLEDIVNMVTSKTSNKNDQEMLLKGMLPGLTMNQIQKVLAGDLKFEDMDKVMKETEGIDIEGRADEVTSETAAATMAMKEGMEELRMEIVNGAKMMGEDISAAIKGDSAAQLEVLNHILSALTGPAGALGNMYLRNNK